ncbi:translation initiation factor eIF-2B subunit delta-like isoform X2 [Abrus precatorius]|uniref:Translation initiation factor eIF2B subunit delta n=2 Tax=Abrus precatorius TaxID=3816 RepID=A0A8B8JH67_ABRPR|nr:translation initiation factor eIF-2B subunit delta-like isoform X2 [Abrus precatorius]
MDARRVSRAVIDPKVRRVGFFAPRPEPDSPELDSQPPSDSAAHNSVSPVIIPPPRHLSERTAAVPVPDSGFRRQASEEHVPVGSYKPSESLLGTSPAASSPSSSRVGIGDGEFSEDCSDTGWFGRNDSNIPGGGLGLPAVKPPENSADNSYSVAVRAKKLAGGSEKREETAKEVHPDQPSISKPLKAKPTKAERRALQEAQRAAKAASKGSGGTTAVADSSRAAPSKNMRQSSQKKDGPVVMPSVATDKKSGDRPLEKERKKDAPAPRMQFDDKHRVEKAKRRAVVNQTEARKRVELFRHLPQYEYGNQLPKLELKLFQLDSVHPAVFQVGLRFLAGDISGGNARCIEMLRAFQEAIVNYSTPPEKVLARDLTAKISSYVSFLTECRPLSVSMGNAIRFVKSRIAKLPLSHTESEAKAALCSDINRFINEKIILADKVIVGHATTKVRDGDVLLTYGSSCVVEMILLHAHDLGKQFRVVVVDSRPKLESQVLLRRLVAKGLSCTYTHINAISYIMHEVTRVFLGASAILCNGTVYSRVGTACVAMMAHAFSVPVLICCEAYKFHERVQLDSICSNELGDPDAVAMVPGRMDVKYLDNWTSQDNLQLLNLLYDATPSDYVSAIVTDHGMIPPTSVPVIVREYGREHLI